MTYMWDHAEYERAAGSSPGHLAPATATEIIRTLLDGTPPFAALAAERCGVSRQDLNQYMKAGAEGHPALSLFSRAVNAIRAEYIAVQAQRLQNTDKETQHAHRHLAWILTKLDREHFDSRATDHEPTPQVVLITRAHDNPEIQKVSKSLETPEERLH